MDQTIILAVCGVVAAGIGLKYLVRWISFPCQFCGKKVKSFPQVPEQDRQNILAYFREHESREPDKGGLFVCANCQTVHDDFSGEKISWDVDSYGCSTFCKVCGLTVRGCEPSKESTTCDGCKTEYHWQTHERSGFRFFTPPRGAGLLEKCPSGQLDSR